MTGKEEYNKVKEKIKSDVTGKKAAVVSETLAVREELKNNALALTENEGLARLYNESADVGADNLSVQSPLLKIYTAGRTNDKLADGSKPSDGHFYYKPTQTQYKDVIAHIMTISSGFRADGFQGKKDVFNQLLAGVIINDGDMKPFVMYFTGTRLQNLWTFGKEASKFTKRRPVSIPMFALTVQMTLEEKQNSFGQSWIVNFDIMKDANGEPLIVTDSKEFVMLRDKVEVMEDTLASIISSKKTEDTEEPVIRATVIDKDNQVIPDRDDGVTTEDIPF